jgi:RNA-dependent RNA polymerase
MQGPSLINAPANLQKMNATMQYNRGPSGPYYVDSSRTQRPQSARHGPQRNAPQHSMWRPSGEWRNAPEFSVKLFKIKATETTWNILRNFKRHGQISYIEIFEEDYRGERRAKVKFSPPPSTEFWVNRLYQMEAVDGSQYNISVVPWDDPNRPPRSSRVQSPIKPNVSYESKTILWPTSLHIGIMVDQDSMMPLQNILPTIPADLKFTVDLVRKKLVAEFKITFQDPRSQGVTSYVSESKVGEFDRKNTYMFELPFDQLKTISKVDFGTDRFGLAIALESPPRYHRKREDEQACHSDENLTWSDWDTWYRQTDIVYDPYRLQNAVITLHKERPVIDIGILPVSPRTS